MPAPAPRPPPRYSDLSWLNFSRLLAKVPWVDFKVVAMALGNRRLVVDIDAAITQAQLAKHNGKPLGTTCAAPFGVDHPFTITGDGDVIWTVPTVLALVERWERLKLLVVDARETQPSLVPGARPERVVVRARLTPLGACAVRMWVLADDLQRLSMSDAAWDV